MLSWIIRFNLPLFAVLFLNQWIWIAFKENYLVFALLTLHALSLYFLYIAKNTSNKILSTFIFVSLAVMLAFISTTDKAPLSRFQGLDQDIQLRRVNYYKQQNIPLFSKVPYWLELKGTTLSVYSAQKNLTSVLDPNYYYFGSFPRDMQQKGEFIKFPPFYILFAMIGLTVLLKKPIPKYLLIYTLSSLLLITLFGDKNHMGMFTNFAPLVLLTTLGLHKICTFLQKK